MLQKTRCSEKRMKLLRQCFTNKTNKSNGRQIAAKIIQSEAELEWTNQAIERFMKKNRNGGVHGYYAPQFSHQIKEEHIT